MKSLKLKEPLSAISRETVGMAGFAPSPREKDEPFVADRIQALLNNLNKAKKDLKEYKKIIEEYRSEICGMQRALETLNNQNLA